jgi:hypothetical protein
MRPHFRPQQKSLDVQGFQIYCSVNLDPPVRSRKPSPWFLYAWENYSAKIWTLAGRALPGLPAYRWLYPSIILIPLVIVYNKFPPYFLLHLQDGIAWKVLILVLLEVSVILSLDIAQLTTLSRREKLHWHTQAHLPSSPTKLTSCWYEYQGILNLVDLFLLRRMAHSLFHD